MPLTRAPRTAVFIAALFALPAAAQTSVSTYHVTHRYTLGGTGKWDYVAFDTAGHRLFIARQDRVMVVNPDNGTLLGEIPGLNGAHGVAFDDAAGHGFVTSGHDSTVTMFDLKTLKVLAKTIAANDADAVLYDSASKHVFTFNGDAHSATVIDPTSNARIGTIDLGAGPEYAVAAGDGKLYVNLSDEGAIAEIDAVTMRVSRKWSVAPCKESTGLAIDRATHRLFSGCRNKVMAISDVTNGRLVTTVPIGGGVDANGFDPSSANAFSSNGDGTLTVVHEDSANHFHVVQTIPTMLGARTMTIDPQTHTIYLVSAEYNPAPANADPTDAHNRTMKPGTFTLLVIAPSQTP